MASDRMTSARLKPLIKRFVQLAEEYRATMGANGNWAAALIIQLSREMACRFCLHGYPMMEGDNEQHNVDGTRWPCTFFFAVDDLKVRMKRGSRAGKG